MTTLKEFKQTLKLKGVKKLTRLQQKEIKAGNYSSLEDCQLECTRWHTSYGPSGSSNCFNRHPGVWECMDS